MIKKIVVVPIDDRPCHNSLVQKAIENYKELKLVYPKKSDLGHFSLKGDTHALYNFIINEAKDADHLILSLDALMFGGLVQAREAEETINMDNYLTLFNCLKDVKKVNPTLEIFAYSVIMRLTTTVTSSDNLNVWENIFEYSQLVYRAEKDSSFKTQLEEVVSKIPEDALKCYLNARKRNHIINNVAIDLVNEHVLDYLVLVQEDASKYGVHLTEQEVLINKIETLNLNSKIIVKNGTDEMVALLLAKILNKESKSVKLDKGFVDENFIALYEDKPVLKNVYKSLEVANIIVDDNSTSTIFMLPCDSNKSDLAFEDWKESKTSLEDVKEALNKYTHETYGILDLKDANGGDPTYLYNLINEKEENFKAYSAWNTASNALGTFILDMTIAMDNKTSEDYLRHRLLDDAIYQGKVRKQVNQYMKNHDFDVWKMNDSEELNHEVSRLMNEEIKVNPLIKNKQEVKAILPWGRSFEIEMEDK